MLALDLSSFSHERLVHRMEFNGELVEKKQSFFGFGGTDTAFDDIVKFAPIDPVEEGSGIGLFLLVESALDTLPSRFAMKEADQCEAIEDELFAHGVPRHGVLVGGPW